MELSQLHVNGPLILSIEIDDEPIIRYVKQITIYIYILSNQNASNIALLNPLNNVQNGITLNSQRYP